MSDSIEVEITKNIEADIDVCINVDELLLEGCELEFEVEDASTSRINYRDEVFLSIRITSNTKEVLECLHIEEVVEYLKGEGYSVNDPV